MRILIVFVVVLAVSSCYSGVHRHDSHYSFGVYKNGMPETRRKKTNEVKAHTALQLNQRQDRTIQYVYYDEEQGRYRTVYAFKPDEKLKEQQQKYSSSAIYISSTRYYPTRSSYRSNSYYRRCPSPRYYSR